MKFWNWLKGKKTFFIATAMALHAVLVVGVNDNNWSAAWDELLQAAGLVGLRLGIKNS